MSKKSKNKIERWLDEVYPGKKLAHEAYFKLDSRELAIVAAAVLDTALAELLSKRLMDYAISDKFLGIDATPYAPAGTFSSRIQLALLTGVIVDFEYDILILVQKLRNKFAHRVNVTMSDPDVLDITLKMHSAWLDLLTTNKTNHDEYEREMFDLMKDFRKVIIKEPEFGRLPLIMLLGNLQVVWAKLEVPRIEGV